MEAGLTDDPVENLRLFVTEVARTGLVWGLRDEDGWAILDSMVREGDDVMPFWSTEQYAFDAATDEWVEYEVAEVELSTFVDTFLSKMEQEGCLVGPNWPGSDAGLEIDAADLAAAIGAAIGALET
ncbi:MAG: DUF2750 domain-containing protein [Myxococcales bacterium]|nr:DUF2750 domain-containing protein [Myxococcales bacterium]